MANKFILSFCIFFLSILSSILSRNFHCCFYQFTVFSITSYSAIFQMTIVSFLSCLSLSRSHSHKSAECYALYISNFTRNLFFISKLISLAVNILYLLLNLAFSSSAQSTKSMIFKHNHRW